MPRHQANLHIDSPEEECESNRKAGSSFKVRGKEYNNLNQCFLNLHMGKFFFLVRNTVLVGAGIYSFNKWPHICRRAWDVYVL